MVCLGLRESTKVSPRDAAGAKPKCGLRWWCFAALWNVIVAIGVIGFVVFRVVVFLLGYS